MDSHIAARHGHLLGAATTRRTVSFACNRSRQTREMLTIHSLVIHMFTLRHGSSRYVLHRAFNAPPAQDGYDRMMKATVEREPTRAMMDIKFIKMNTCVRCGT